MTHGSFAGMSENVLSLKPQNLLPFARFEVLTATIMKINISKEVGGEQYVIPKCW
jgi:hypothetical protein